MLELDLYSADTTQENMCQTMQSMRLPPYTRNYGSQRSGLLSSLKDLDHQEGIDHTDHLSEVRNGVWRMVSARAHQEQNAGQLICVDSSPVWRSLSPGPAIPCAIHIVIAYWLRFACRNKVVVQQQQQLSRSSTDTVLAVLVSCMYQPYYGRGCMHYYLYYILQ